MPKQTYRSAVPAELAGIVRLFRLQALLLAVCVGLGAVLYGLPPVIATAALVLMMGAVLSLWPHAGGWAAALWATGTMYLLATVLPPDWLQGPAFVMLALTSAAAGLCLGVNRFGSDRIRS